MTTLTLDPLQWADLADEATRAGFLALADALEQVVLLVEDLAQAPQDVSAEMAVAA